MSNAIVMRPMPFTVVTASGTLPGYSRDNIALDHMGVVWKAQTSGAQTHGFVIDLGSDQPVDTIALLGLTGADSSWIAAVGAATEAVGPSFTTASGHFSYPSVSLLAGSAMPTSGRGRFYWQKPATGPAAARYWRILITAPAVNTPITVARAVFGQRIRLERNFSFGAGFGVRELGKVDWSAHGVLLRRRGVKMRSVGLSFAALYRDEVENAVQPLIERVGGTGPILVVTDTDAHAQRQNRIYFGPMIGELGTVWARANGFQWQVNVVDLEKITGDT